MNLIAILPAGDKGKRLSFKNIVQAQRLRCNQKRDSRMTGSLGGWGELVLAFALFIASHLVPARPSTRALLIRRLGKATYLLGHSALSLVLFSWLIVAAGRAPYVAIWSFSPWQMWIPNLIMPFVCLLLVFGIAAPNPLSIVGRNNESFDPDKPGIAGVTRHPVLWAATLWAFAHLVPNGNLAHVVLFGSFGLLGLGGAWAVDARTRRALGAEEWSRLTHRTSFVPLVALVDGRWRPSVRDLDMMRLGVAAVLYLGLLLLHEQVIGVSPYPPL